VRAIVLAGRRYRDETLVRAALLPHLERHRGATLVCSAAAGADLVALDLASALGLPCRIVLPSDAAEFRRGSVEDRGERWVTLFRELVERALPERLVAIQPGGEDPYLAANTAILDEGMRVAGDPREVLAIIVWDGKRERPPDYTEAFRTAAVERGFEVVELRVPE
jgi:hypothetical protein